MTDVLTIRTHFDDLSELSEGLADRVDEDQLILYGPTMYDEGSTVGFAVLLADGSSALQGSGRVTAAVDGGEEREPETRYDIVFDSLQLDGTSEVVYERIVLARQSMLGFEPSTGEVDVSGLDAASADANPYSDADPSSGASHGHWASEPPAEVDLGEVALESLPPRPQSEAPMDVELDAMLSASSSSESPGAPPPLDGYAADDNEAGFDADADTGFANTGFANTGFADEARASAAPADAYSEPPRSSDAPPYSDATPYSDALGAPEDGVRMFDSDLPTATGVDIEQPLASELSVDELAVEETYGVTPTSLGPPPEDPPIAPSPELPPPPAGFQIPKVDGLTRPAHPPTWQPYADDPAELASTSQFFAYAAGQLPVPNRAPRPELDSSWRIQAAPRPDSQAPGASGPGGQPDSRPPQIPLPDEGESDVAPAVEPDSFAISDYVDSDDEPSAEAGGLGKANSSQDEEAYSSDVESFEAELVPEGMVESIPASSVVGDDDPISESDVIVDDDFAFDADDELSDNERV